MDGIRATTVDVNGDGSVGIFGDVGDGLRERSIAEDGTAGDFRHILIARVDVASEGEEILFGVVGEGGNQCAVGGYNGQPLMAGIAVDGITCP